MRKIVAIICISALLLGLIVGNISNLIQDNQSCIKYCDSAHQPKYGTAWVSKKAEGQIYRINKPNASGWADNLGMPPYYVNTNNKGLREEPFNREKPDNTVRILVVGDSFTFGPGVNRSDIYTEVIERKLDKKFPGKKIQVINAGIPGTGMKDYYLFLKHRGLEYNPDITVIAFINNDQISASTSHKLLQEAKSAIGKRNSNVTDFSNRSDIRKKYHELLERHKNETPVQNSSFSYISDIHSLTTKENTTAIYYSINGLEPSIRSFIENWSKENNQNILYSPQKFRQDKTDKMRISKWNGHPDPAGHKAIANRLLTELEEKVAKLDKS